MAQPFGPLLSERASGTLGKLLTFAETKHRPLVRRKPENKPPFSLVAEYSRAVFQFAGTNWLAVLTQPERDEWTALERASNQTPYNRYLVGQFDQPLDVRQPRTRPTGAGNVQPTAGLADPTAIGGKTYATISWQWAAANDNYGLLNVWFAIDGAPPIDPHITPILLANDGDPHEFRWRAPRPGTFLFFLLNFTLDGSQGTYYAPPPVTIT